MPYIFQQCVSIWLAIQVLSASPMDYQVLGLNVDVVTVRICAPSSSPKSQHLFFPTLRHSNDGKQLSGPPLFMDFAVNKASKEEKGEMFS